MVEEAGRLLDELMGKNRNGDRPDEVISSWRDKRVCPAYLLGCCPYNLFAGSKSDMGPCPFPCCGNLTADRMRAQYDADPDAASAGYEQSLLFQLRNIIAAADRKGREALARIRATAPPGYQCEFQAEDDPAVAELSAALETARGEITRARAARDSAAAVQAEAEHRDLRMRKAELQAKAVLSLPEGAGDTHLRVCVQCSAYVSSKDSDERLVEHFTGKVHESYVVIRRRLEELEAWAKYQAQSQAQSSSSGRQRSSRSRSRSRSTSRRSPGRRYSRSPPRRRY